MIFVKMHTDAGVVGIGEGTVEGRIGTVVAAIKELEPYLIGKDPSAPSTRARARRHFPGSQAGSSATATA